jgi:hypothetical protein
MSRAIFWDLQWKGGTQFKQGHPFEAELAHA